MNLNEQYAVSKAFEILKNDQQNDMVNHAYLIYGADGLVVKAFAKSMAKQLLCATHLPCNTCTDCKNIEQDIYADCLVFPLVGSAGLKVEDANKIVAESMVKPLLGERKVILINDADKATVSAQNKLLKTLEEPTPHVVFILNATNVHGLLPTLLSRTKKIYTDKLMEQGQDSDLKQLALQLLLTLKRSSEVLKFSTQVLQKENQIPLLFTQVQSLLLDTLKLHAKLSVPDADLLTLVAGTYPPRALKRLFDATLQAGEQLNANCNKNAVIEHFLFQILEVRHQCQIVQA